MKKIISSFLFYTLFACAVVFCFGFFTATIPDHLPETSELFYKFSNGLVTLFDILPSICFTAFLLGCSIAFGPASSKAEHRFSTQLSGVLKKMLFMAIAVTLVISLCTLVFLPVEKSKQQTMKNIPNIINNYKKLARKYEKNTPDLALKYADRALSMDPKNEELAELKKDIEIKNKEHEIDEKREKSISYAETNLNDQKKLPDFFDESKMSVKEMLVKAQGYYEEHDYFGAHYFSINAKRLCQENDESYKDIDKLVSDSWEALKKVEKEEATDGMIFFRKKLAAYTKFINNQFVDSYYDFYELSQEDARKERDPDVVRYLELAQQRVLETYFFIDETEDLNTFENVNNLYFTITKPQGGFDIVTIRGVTEIEGSGGLVRYLRDLQIWSFDAQKKLVYKMKTPYAKMSAIKVSDLTDSERRTYVSDSSTKMIPLIKLCSLNRSTSKEKNSPEYTFTNNATPSEGQALNKFYWPMPYQDFAMIAQNFSGQGNLNPFAVRTLAKKAPDYGYAREVFNYATMNKIFYPFMIFSFLIFIAIIAWNYRLGAGVIFKFKWIFILPVFNFFFYFVRRAVEYMVNVMNFVFIAFAGVDLAYLAGIVFYILLLGAMILTFLARKGD